ncbi:MAG TPA: hypothetical protein PKC19_23075 [Roseiflexaceae bacterium]|nr:hypothetical protein [Roseiflexaceae bacterium]
MTTGTVTRPNWRTEEPEWVVWLTVILALLIGLGLRSAVVGRMQTVQAGPTTISYPANWVEDTEEGTPTTTVGHSGRARASAR